ncbi:hypothetical protein CYMTET_18038 [Cymbomonas tetramitiformis]|uniref:Uncharacterized protein n=1 Tax=Cymbomonas tetramitiformis TaxID=36881 RepID=A0AAE0L6J4_9CHLO|nr:hypothetical protein CYMTET_18038 [Cymbomonas tetramitiformis]
MRGRWMVPDVKECVVEEMVGSLDGASQVSALWKRFTVAGWCLIALWKRCYWSLIVLDVGKECVVEEMRWPLGGASCKECVVEEMRGPLDDARGVSGNPSVTKISDDVFEIYGI